MSGKLSAEQTAELRKAFNVMDANGDGVVTKEELKTLLSGLGEEVTDEIVDEMINIADADGDGKVNFEEFVNAATSGAMWTRLWLTHKSNKHLIQFVVW